MGPIMEVVYLNDGHEGWRQRRSGEDMSARQRQVPLEDGALEPRQQNFFCRNRQLRKLRLHF